MKKVKRPVIVSLFLVFSLFCHISLYNMVSEGEMARLQIEETIEVQETKQSHLLPDARLVKFILEVVRRF